MLTGLRRLGPARAAAVLAVALAIITLLAWRTLLWMTPAPDLRLNVRWTAGVDDVRRAALERQLHLTRPAQTEGTTYSYNLPDPSADRIRAIVLHPQVEDTAHVNRARFRPEFGQDRERRAIFHAVIIGSVGAVAVLVWVLRHREPAAAAKNIQSSPASHGRPGLLLWAVAAPPLLLAAGTLVLIILGRFGLNPFWPHEQVTIAEAIALRDRATVTALAETGIDLDARYRVRPGLLDNDNELWVTPPEAAIRAERTEILDELFKAGLAPDDEAVRRWICLARRHPDGPALADLTARFVRLAAETTCPATP